MQNLVIQIQLSVIGDGSETVNEQTLYCNIWQKVFFVFFNSV